MVWFLLYEAARFGFIEERSLSMEYFVGFDVSLEKTRVCVLDCDGTVTFDVCAASAWRRSLQP